MSEMFPCCQELYWVGKISATGAGTCIRRMNDISQTMLGGCSSLFDGQATSYSRFRPSHPQESFDIIYDFRDFAGGPQIALDLAMAIRHTAKHLAGIFAKICICSQVNPKAGPSESIGM